MTPSEKSIIATLSYFDIFNFPLTLVEVWKWLLVAEPAAPDLASVQQALEHSDYLRRAVETKNGFYFFRGRADIIQTRRERYSLAEHKYHKAVRLIRWLRLMPFVRMIAVCNTLAYNNSRREADIDLFIITTRRRVWQVRFWVTGFLKLCGLRPSPGNTQDKICSSFFVDEDHLDLRQLAVADDVYLPYWVTQVMPVYDQGVYRQFLEANRWVRAKLPNFLPIRPTSRRSVSRIGVWKKLINGICFFWPESLFKTYQMKIMPPGLKEQANKGSQVVVQDFMLKFHDNDRRQLFLNRWQEKMSHYS